MLRYRVNFSKYIKIGVRVNYRYLLKLSLTLMLCINTLSLSASEVVKLSAIDEKPFAETHLVLQLSDADEAKQSMVLSNANNLIKYYGGPDAIDIEIVTFGPGVKLLFSNTKFRSRIESLIANEVRFVICQNTLDTIARKTHKVPEILPQAIHVRAGIAHIIERAKQGYIVVRP